VVWGIMDGLLTAYVWLGQENGLVGDGGRLASWIMDGYSTRAFSMTIGQTRH